jgi:alkylhydroperoxidase family enzyme
MGIVQEERAKAKKRAVLENIIEGCRFMFFNVLLVAMAMPAMN